MCLWLLVDDYADRKAYAEVRTKYLVNALLLYGRDTRDQLDLGEIGLKDLEAFWSGVQDMEDRDVTQSSKPSTSHTKSKVGRATTI